jgi:hypothetical protein
MNIRKITAEDMPQIHAWHAFLTEQFSEEVIDPLAILEGQLFTTGEGLADVPHVVVVAGSNNGKPKLHAGVSADLVPYEGTHAVGRIAYAGAKGKLGVATLMRSCMAGAISELEKQARKHSFGMARVLVEADKEAIPLYEKCGFRRLLRDDGAPLSYIRPPLDWNEEGHPRTSLWTNLTLMMYADEERHRRVTKKGYAAMFDALLALYIPHQLEKQWSDKAHTAIVREVERCKKFLTDSTSGSKYLVMEPELENSVPLSTPSL